jgi:hypothetical protein
MPANPYRIFFGVELPVEPEEKSDHEREKLRQLRGVPRRGSDEIIKTLREETKDPHGLGLSRKRA